MTTKILSHRFSPGSDFTVLLSGTGQKTGDWVKVDEFDILSTQAYALSGTSGTEVLGLTSGTFSGTIQIQQSFDISEKVTPYNSVSHTDHGIQQVGIRSTYLRAKCTEWAGDNYVVLLKAYKQYRKE